MDEVSKKNFAAIQQVVFQIQGKQQDQHELINQMRGTISQLVSQLATLQTEIAYMRAMKLGSGSTA